MTAGQRAHHLRILTQHRRSWVWFPGNGIFHGGSNGRNRFGFFHGKFFHGQRGLFKRRIQLDRLRLFGSGLNFSRLGIFENLGLGGFEYFGVLGLFGCRLLLRRPPTVKHRRDGEGAGIKADDKLLLLLLVWIIDEFAEFGDQLLGGGIVRLAFCTAS